MRKYLKPALEIEAFDVEDIITASILNPNQPYVDPNATDEEEGGDLAAPIDVIELN